MTTAAALPPPSCSSGKPGMGVDGGGGGNNHADVYDGCTASVEPICSSPPANPACRCERVPQGVLCIFSAIDSLLWGPTGLFIALKISAFFNIPP